MKKKDFGKCKKCDGIVRDNPEILKKVMPYYMIYMLVYFTVFLVWMLKVSMVHYNFADMKSAPLYKLLVTFCELFVCFMFALPLMVYDNHGKVLICTTCNEEYRRQEYNAYELTVKKYVLGCFIAAAIFVFGAWILDWIKDSYL